jgi:acetyltransferase-like isoleucine patch superfamily enzyme
MSEFFARLYSFYWLFKTQVFYRPRLGSLAPRSRIIRPLKLQNLQNIFIGRNVTINKHTWLLTLKLDEKKNPKMIIGDDAEIGHFNHITCVDYVEIGAKVLTADGVFISDNSHGYDDPKIPIIDQPIVSKSPVIIGVGSWLGENVSVLSCRIGRNCVIGANSVVNRDIPDFCIAAGVPARVIKRYDWELKEWKRI